MSFIFFIKMKTFTKRDLVLKLFDININQTVPFLIDKLVDYICEEVFFNKSDLDSEHQWKVRASEEDSHMRGI